MLMRQKAGKNAVLHESIRPAVVQAAAQYLVSTDLYQSEGVCLSNHLPVHHSKIDFVTDDLSTNHPDKDESSDEEEEEPLNPGEIY